MAMNPIQFQVALFLGPKDMNRSRLSLSALLTGLVLHNELWLQYYPKTPRLYDTSVVYRAETRTENWRDIPTVLAAGFGDCEDLAAWRCAELRRQGVGAMPFVTWRKGDDGRTIYHALVRHPDDRIEDPSRALGMRHPIVRRPVFITKPPEVIRGR